MVSNEDPLESNFLEQYNVTDVQNGMENSFWWSGKFRHPNITSKFYYLVCSLKERTLEERLQSMEETMLSHLNFN